MTKDENLAYLENCLQGKDAYSKELANIGKEYLRLYEEIKQPLVWLGELEV